MNKIALIGTVAERTGSTKKDAERVVNATFDVIAESLAAGDKVQVSGFGNFEVKHRNARTARNPRTKETVEVPASNVPSFKPAKALKEKV